MAPNSAGSDFANAMLAPFLLEDAIQIQDQPDATVPEYGAAGNSWSSVKQRPEALDDDLLLADQFINENRKRANRALDHYQQTLGRGLAPRNHIELFI